MSSLHNGTAVAAQLAEQQIPARTLSPPRSAPSLGRAYAHRNRLTPQQLLKRSNEIYREYVEHAHQSKNYPWSRR